MPDAHRAAQGPMPEGHRAIQEEFGRAAQAFCERTRGRFDDMDVVGFSRPRSGDVVAEVGAGTGNFLALFSDVASRLIAIDLTSAMLAIARRDHAGIETVAADGARLPLRARSVDLVATAQALHHIRAPVPVLAEMRRVCADGGRVLIVDQAAPEMFEQAALMNELDSIRDPTHAATRPPSAFRIMAAKAGLEIVDERLWEGRARLSRWMWLGEFPPERIAAVRAAVERFGPRTGMEWTSVGDDWEYTRRRIMLLAVPGR